MTAGLKLLSLIYSGNLNNSLNKLRYLSYQNVIASKPMKPLHPERLPPTENASTFHIYRVFLQVMQWKTFMACAIMPEDWGWQLKEGRYIPVATDIAAAPDDMLTIIRCKCKMETKHPCSSQLCTCFKHGLTCVAACKNCNGCDCENAEIRSNPMADEDAYEVLDPSSQTIIHDDDMELIMPFLYEEEVT